MVIKDIYEEFNEELDTKANSEFDLRFSENDDISISIIQRKCKVGYKAASRLMGRLIKNNRVVKNGYIFSVGK